MICLVSLNAFSQNANIIGSLSDKQGELPGASVIVKETSAGSITDNNGKFDISVAPGKYTLVFSFIGYKSVERKIDAKAGQKVDLGKIELKASDNELSEVNVTSSYEKGSDAKAISMIKNSDKVVSVVSAETIAKLPTKNAAEAVKRMAGANVQNNKGEGSVVSLRGTPSDWTATFINGDRLPVADEENTTRSFEFEVLPSDLVDFVVVTRSVTPDMEGDNIGGAINFITRQSVDTLTIKADISGGWNFLAQKPLGKASLVLGNRSKNGKFSYLVNASYYGRYYAADAYRVVYGSNFNHGISSLELKDYNGYRGTVGVNSALQYKVNENVVVGTNFIFGDMVDDKYQKKTRYNYNDGSGSRVRLQNIHGKLLRQLYGGDIYANINISKKVKLDLRAAQWNNRFKYGNVPYSNGDDRNGYFYVEFMSPLIYYTDMDFVDFYGNATDISAEDKIITKLIGDDNPYGTGDDYRNIQPKPLNPQNPDEPLAPSDYEFYQAFSELNDTWERDPIVAQMDLTVEASKRLKFKMGGKFRDKQGVRRISLHQWIQRIPIRSEPYLLTDFETEPFDEQGGFLEELGSPYAGTFMPFLTQDQLNNFVQPLGDTLREYVMNPYNVEYRFWAGSKYEYKEKQMAGYLMADGKVSDKITLVGGLRIEYTMLDEKSDTLLDSLAFDPVSSQVYYVPEERRTLLNYLAILPALNMNYFINDRSNLRAAVSRTFHRPNFAQTKPGYGVYCIEDLDFTFGNSQLKPSYSINFDLMYERYWPGKGFFSIGGYYKYVTDHIFATTTSDIDNFGIVIKKYDNAPVSYVVGTEASITRRFDFLKGFLKDFGVNANISYSFSRMQVPGRPSSQAMTEQTPLLYNAALFYENNKLNVRFGFTYNGPYLIGLNLAAVENLDGEKEILHQDTDFDFFKGENYSMDAQISYKLGKHFNIYAEGTNLLNYPELTYRGKKERPIRTEYYRQRGMIGIRYEL